MIKLQRWRTDYWLPRVRDGAVGGGGRWGWIRKPTHMIKLYRNRPTEYIFHAIKRTEIQINF